MVHKRGEIWPVGQPAKVQQPKARMQTILRQHQRRQDEAEAAWQREIDRQVAKQCRLLIGKFVTLKRVDAASCCRSGYLVESRTGAVALVSRWLRTKAFA